MNNIVIVSGGANGLGYELVKVLHNNGFFVCNIDNDKTALKHIENEFSNNYKSFCGNVADEKFIISTVNKISKLGNIVALFNNAGSPVFKLPTQYNAQDVDLCFEGLKGMIYLSANTLKVMEQTGGKIINIMSSAALRGNKQESVYCATKWAERGYTESLKACYNGTKVQIFGVYPGGINTNFYKNSRDYVSKEKQSTFMPPKDLAEVIYDNIFNDKKLVVEDLIINRIK
jgi:NADP-dependent 3-hydroxy acid dehydrogenase YdfG